LRVVPLGDMTPILFAPNSVNQIFPSGPRVRPCGALLAVGMVYSVKTGAAAVVGAKPISSATIIRDAINGSCFMDRKAFFIIPLWTNVIHLCLIIPQIICTRARNCKWSSCIIKRMLHRERLRLSAYTIDVRRFETARSGRVVVMHIEGVPHNVQYVKPEELFAQCKDFLEKGVYDA